MRGPWRIPSRGAVVVWMAGGFLLGSIAVSAAEEQKGERAVFSLASRVERVVVARVPNGIDLLEGLQAVVKKEGVRNAAIVSGSGSLTSYHVHTVGNTTLPSKNVFSKGEGPWDLLSVTGYVIDGRIHAHITIVDAARAFGGHLEPGTKVFTFAIVTFGELEEGASLARFDDSSWNGAPELRGRE
jgi:uncharacterized protein